MKTTSSAFTTCAPAASAPARCTPEFFPLPQRGVDPYFGIGRSSYYDLERRGLLKLRRLRKPGMKSGRVLICYAEASALVHKLTDEVAAS